MMRATVEEAHCVGCGMCVDVCPQIFSFTEQHRAQGGDDLGRARQDARIGCGHGDAGHGRLLLLVPGLGLW